MSMLRQARNRIDACSLPAQPLVISFPCAKIGGRSHVRGTVCFADDGVSAAVTNAEIDAVGRQEELPRAAADKGVLDVPEKNFARDVGVFSDRQCLRTPRCALHVAFHSGADIPVCSATGTHGSRLVPREYRDLHAAAIEK